MRQIAWNAVKSADAVLLVVEIKKGRRNRQTLTGLPEESRAQAIKLISIGVAISRLDRSCLNVAAGRTVITYQRKGIGHNPVDPAAHVGFRAYKAQSKLVLHQRDVEHEIVVMIETAPF